MPPGMTWLRIQPNEFAGMPRFTFVWPTSRKIPRTDVRGRSSTIQWPESLPSCSSGMSTSPLPTNAGKSVINVRYVDPRRNQFEAFKALRRDKPIMMLNLVYFCDTAAYEDGRETAGAEADAAYGKASAPVFQRVGGEIVWRGTP